ncbi:MAG: 30S ribosomal protein S17 [Planctomycetes bacterium]|nr:30S ribosomal protein S17 [Planctomycetota bacterium]
MAASDASKATQERKGRRTVRGIVVSDKMQKTIIVRSERMVLHPIYKKYMRRFTKYYAHDEERRAKVGDTVEIAMTRPLSKTKRWRLVDIVAKSTAAPAFDSEVPSIGGGAP